MLTNIFVFLCRFAPVKRVLWRRWYDFLAGNYGENDWTFMNYGYASVAIPLEPEDEPNRYCIQLYDFVASAADLKGMRVLEVGSGRGGGASYIARHHKPAGVTGVDFSAKAVAFCRKAHRVEGLSFEVGSAESLPFIDESFDVVLNVESSHCYGSMDTFLSEVRRALRPGGVFLYADLRKRHGLADWRTQLNNSQMNISMESDITANVVAALDADNDRKSAMIQKLIPRPLLAPFTDFAGMRGSAIYEGFRTGSFVYRVFKLEK